MEQLPSRFFVHRFWKTAREPSLARSCSVNDHQNRDDDSGQTITHSFDLQIVRPAEISNRR
jgi:hypothetical protein